MISNKIAPVILDICKISLDIKANEINAKQIKAIAYQLNQWKLKIVDTQGFAHAEASGGGCFFVGDSFGQAAGSLPAG
jgi:predicted flavoprotein YhiN